MIRRVAILAAILAWRLFAQDAAVSNLRVVGAGPTWAVVAYSSIDDGARRVEASDESDFTPLHPDVDGALYANRYLDTSRATTLARGRERFVRIGHGYAKADANGRSRSMALQNMTRYWVRVGGAASGSTVEVVTSLPRAGINHSTARPALAAAGEWAFVRPSLDSAERGTAADTYPDYATGNPVRQWHWFNDRFGTSDLNNDCLTASEGAGTSWTEEPDACNDNAVAVSSSSGTDILTLTYPTVSFTTDLVGLRVLFEDATGGGTLEVAIDAAGDGTVDTPFVSLVLPGTPANTFLPDKNWTGAGQAAGGVASTVFDTTWGLLNQNTINNSVNFQLQVRRVSGTVSADRVRVDFVAQQPVSWFDGAPQLAWNPLLAADASGDEGYLLQTRATTARGNISFVNRVTGASTYIGWNNVTGLACGTPSAMDYGSSTFGDGLREYLVVGTCGGTQRVIKFTPTGSIPDASVAPHASHSGTYSTLEDDLEAAMVTYTTANGPIVYDSANFTPQSYGSGPNGDLVIRARRGAQNSIGWLFVWREGTGIIAATPTWLNPSMRWGGEHTLRGTANNWLQIEPGLLNGSTAGLGPYEVAFVACAGDGCTANQLTDCGPTCQTTITVASTHSTPGEPLSSNAPAELMAKAAGDFLCVLGCGSTCPGNGEIFRIASITSPTIFVVDRDDAFGGAGTEACAAPGQLRMITKARYFAEASTRLCNIIWDYATDPDGSSAFTRACNDGGGGHNSLFGGYWVSITDSTGDYTACLSAEGALGSCPQKSIETTTSIDGNSASLAANVFQLHPASAMNSAAPAGQRVWAFDAVPFSTTLGSYDPGSPVNVSGDLWRFASPQTQSIKRWPIVVFAGTRPLQEISSAALGDATISAWQFCYVYAAGECRTGSTVGQIYANVPGWSGTDLCKSGQWATGGGTDGPEDGACAVKWPTLAHAVVQFRMDRDAPNGEGFRVLAVPQMPPHYWSDLMTVKPMPGFGTRQWVATSWAVQGYRGGVFGIGAPPTPPDDSIGRAGFVPYRIDLAPPAAIGGVTVDNVIVHFGYDLPGSLYCVGALMASDGWTGRAERCSLGDAADYPGDPYGLETANAVSGAPRAAAMSFSVPLVPERPAYYRVDYRDASNNVLATSGVRFAQ